MNVTGAPTATTCKAIFKRAIKQLDEGDGSFPAARHRPIVHGRAIAPARSNQQALKEAADALATLWRNRKR